MSIASDAKIRDLEKRVVVLEELVRLLREERDRSIAQAPERKTGRVRENVI